jgi:hypothetical protein
MDRRDFIKKTTMVTVGVAICLSVAAMLNEDKAIKFVLANSNVQSDDHNNLTVLMQSDFSSPNTVYVIKYDYVLAEDITVPENCMLKFEGGSVSGAYTITGSNTTIQAGLVKIFSVDVNLAGTWNVDEAYPEWFGAKGDGVTDDVFAIMNAINLSNIKLQGKTYYISKCLNVCSNRCIVGEKGVTVIKISDYGKRHNIVMLSEVSNVIIKDIIFTVDKFEWFARTNNDHSSREYRRYNELREQEKGGGIKLNNGCTNIVLDGIEVFNSGYGILAYMSNKHVTVRNCYIHHTMIDGIAIYVGNSHFVVENNRLEYTCDDSISVVSTHDGGVEEECSDIIVKGNCIWNCYARPFIVNGSKNVTFENNTVLKNGLQLFYISNITGNHSVDPLSRPRNIKILNNYFCFSYLSVPPSIENRLFVANSVDNFTFDGNTVAYCDEYDASKGNYMQIFNTSGVIYKNNFTEHAGVKIINSREIIFNNNRARVCIDNSIAIEKSVNFDISHNYIYGTNITPSKVKIFSSSSNGIVRNNTTENSVYAIGTGATGIQTDIYKENGESSER